MEREDPQAALKESLSPSYPSSHTAKSQQRIFPFGKMSEHWTTVAGTVHSSLMGKFLKSLISFPTLVGISWFYSRAQGNFS